MMSSFLMNSRMKKIQAYVKERNKLRRYRVEAEERLENYGTGTDPIKIYLTKEQIYNYTNEENYQNFLIAENIRKAKISDAKDAVSGSPTQETVPPESVDVSEMSVGEESLSGADKVKSESALAEVREDAIKDLKQRIGDAEFDQALKQRTDEWKTSDPAIQEAVSRNENLMRRATEEYERRQKNAEVAPSEENHLIQAVRAPGAYPWPGEQNPNQPFENPVALEEERELAILKIHQELKQSELMMETHDRITEDSKASKR